MADIKVKADFKDFKIGFNNNYAALGERKDLHLLIRDAISNNDRSILDMFDSVPTEKQIKDTIAAELKGKLSKIPSANDTNSTQRDENTGSNTEGGTDSGNEGQADS